MVTLCGVVGENHVPYSALEELVSFVKPGGCCIYSLLFVCVCVGGGGGSGSSLACLLLFFDARGNETST